MPTWTEDRLAEFSDLVGEFGSTFTYGTSTIPCIRTPLRLRFNASPVSGYDREVECTVDILRIAAVTIGLYPILKAKNPNVKRPTCTVDSDIMEVESMVEDDDAEAAIRILCVAKQ